MFIKNRMLEIEEALGPHLETLGLTCEVKQDGHFLRVMFERPGEQKWRSPIEIWFIEEHSSQHSEASWEEADVIRNEVAAEPMGSNGWVYYETVGREHWNADSAQYSFDLVSEMLGKEDLYPTGRNIPNVPNNGQLSHIWGEFVGELRREFGLRESEFALSRNEAGSDIVSFEYLDSQFELVWLARGAEAVLLVDGEERARSDISGPDVIRMMIRQLADAELRY